MTAPAVAEDTGFVVLGSWSELPLAEAGRAEVRARLGVQADILPARIDGERRFRLDSPAMVEGDAHAMIADLATHGVSAWFLRGDLVAPGTPRAREVSPGATPAEPGPAPDPAGQSTSSEPSAMGQDQPAPPDRETATTTTTGQPADPVRPATVSRAEPADPDTGAAVHVPYFETVNIAVDGVADEAAWSEVPGYDDMRVTDPDTLEDPEYRTFYRFLYTRDGLYVAAFMEQPPDTLVSRLSSRDRYLNRDSFGITLDTSGEGLYGYWFTVTLGGSLMDGKAAPETHHFRAVGRTLAWRQRPAGRRLERRDVPALVHDGDARSERCGRRGRTPQAHVLGGPQGVAPGRES